LKSDKTEDGVRTQIYQAALLNKEFAFPLQVVVILKPTWLPMRKPMSFCSAPIWNWIMKK